MKQLAKILVTASMATLLGMSSTADAKGSKKSKAKRATPAKAAAQPQTPVSDVPWYEQGIEDLAPVAKVRVKPAPAQPIQVTTLDQLGSYQRRKTLAPSGKCTTGCDKTARNINMATLVLVKDSKAKAKKNAKSKKVKARKTATPKKVSSITKQASKR